MKYHVEFQNVGRDKLTWRQWLTVISEVSLSRAIKKKRALMSKGLDFAWDDNNKGEIFAGMRPVGTFEVIEVSA